MGNQPSSEKKGKGEKGSNDGVPLGREYYRSFERSDTKDSTRSLRNSIKSKIPGAGKTDSPRASVANLNDTNGKVDSRMLLLQNQLRVAQQRVRDEVQTPLHNQKPANDATDQGDAAADEVEPPPSPVQGATLGSVMRGFQRPSAPGKWIMSQMYRRPEFHRLSPRHSR